ncbi:hypothetical protein T12_4159 [Trichinella patagoniensis]|uniref:Uncharacterized protein n=1 Tax=Trichinella patagoniensis TaxID=990121 RepID=A0A0V0ZB59_9BILA|nr:hypothetical protein T12_4159 [Trichinella patagoniensis]
MKLSENINENIFVKKLALAQRSSAALAFCWQPFAPVALPLVSLPHLAVSLHLLLLQWVEYVEVADDIEVDPVSRSEVRRNGARLILAELEESINETHCNDFETLLSTEAPVIAKSQSDIVTIDENVSPVDNS